VLKKPTVDKISVTRDSFIASVAFLSNACSTQKITYKIGQLKNALHILSQERKNGNQKSKLELPLRQNENDYHPNLSISPSRKITSLTCDLQKEKSCNHLEGLLSLGKLKNCFH
jgi:hypothetical protein